MFLSTGGGGGAGGPGPGGCLVETTRTAITAGDTHPTGMHSCLQCIQTLRTSGEAGLKYKYLNGRNMQTTVENSWTRRQLRRFSINISVGQVTKL